MTFDERHRRDCANDDCDYCALPSEAPPFPRPKARMRDSSSTKVTMGGLIVEMYVDGQRFLFVDDRLFQLIPWLLCVLLGMGICSFGYVLLMSWQSIVG
ncbi:MAG: hypothetical protein KJ063_02525 [Anaerolineae bacterium]|nr:hypothetical protein [Anaerolineae bacterium]